MAVPVVAIVGRPNVGKSSLFNWLAGKRIAIVDPTPGVTRDRVSTLVPVQKDSATPRASEASPRGRYFELMDTGGIGIRDCDNLTDEVERQIQLAIDAASLVLFVVDARSGLVALDEVVAERLRVVTKPVICVVNKCDTDTLETHASDFHRLGFTPLISVSAHQGRGKTELLKHILKRLPESDGAETSRDVAMKLAIVGRRNTGKSTFINALAESERMIVSEVAGTTRDSVDVRFERDGKMFIAIDTAGVRRKKSVKGDIEFYSMARAERSIRRADVVMMFFDPRWTVSKVDKQLAEYILENHKPAIFVVNKWDLAKPQIATGEFADYLRKVFPTLDYVPIAFITAKDGRNVHKLLNLAQNLFKQAAARVSTSDLNRVLRAALDEQAPPSRQNRRPKIFYGSQVATQPPTIVLMTNGPDLFDNTYVRYLEKTFRDRLPFRDVPIHMYLRSKRREDRPAVDESAEPREKKPRPQKIRAKPAKRKRDRQQPELWND
jgi:GTP-binding protein